MTGLKNIRTRHLQDCNYAAIFSGTYTIRRKIDKSKPFLSQINPEVEDVAINNTCHGNCPYCYVASNKDGQNFTSICQKASEVYGALPIQRRPFQIAVGGAGEPTLHPDFIPFLKVIRSLDILPNYTTNGMHLTKEILSATKEYCGGTAVSWHPHLKGWFYPAIESLIKEKIKTSIHVIIGEPNSVVQALSLASSFSSVENIVVLPYQNLGRAKKIDPIPEWDKFFFLLKEDRDKGNTLHSKMAFGAGFYPYFQLKGTELNWLDLDTYEPEMFSGYRIFDDTYKILRKSSYDPSKKETI